jgi:signal transduction histidine kinase
MDEPAASPWRRLFSLRMVLGVWLPIALVSAMHYGTPACHHWVHDVARRLYYLPIILGAFFAGSRGGLTAAVIASAAYLPHAFTHIAHMDPGTPLEKFLEVVLYVVVGLVGGVLVDRERAERVRQQELAQQLQRTLDDLRETEQQLVRSGRLGALGELTVGLAHEIRNPLHAMRGTAEIVRDAVDEASPQRRMADLQLQEIDRLSGVLERFLTFARPQVTHQVEVDLVEVVRRVEELTAAQARKDDVIVEAALPAGPQLVRGDPEQLIQVALSVVLNGLDALQDCPADRWLRVSVTDEQRAAKSYRVIDIANAGPPIPEDMLERIFDPFVTTKDDGTGLGLSIAARIVDAHGGHIEAVNLDDGVSFKIRIPAA